MKTLFLILILAWSSSAAIFPRNATKIQGITICTTTPTDTYALTYNQGTGMACWTAPGEASMVYPGAGVPNSTGSAWGTSYTVGTGANNLVQLNGSSQLPAVSAALLTNFPTLNQSTTGSAATLTTPRSIYGNNFDGSAALNQIIASTYGGTGNGFTKFTGPATAERTFTLPNSDATLLYSGGPLVGSSASIGSSPPAVTAGTGGVEALGEGTAPTSGCPAAGVGCFYADSTAHRILLSNNNAAASAIAVQADKLSVFAATTSAELAGVLSDESGSSGGFVRAGSPALTTPDLGTPSAVNLTNATALPNSALTASIKSSGFGASFDGGGSAIATNATAYMTIAAACTIAASNILVDAGTLTFKVWRVAAGTAIPTSGDSINTSGIAISTGTALRTTTVTDYTDTTLDANDILAITLTAVSGATKANIFVECNR